MNRLRILMALFGTAILLASSACLALDNGFYTDPSLSFDKVNEKIITLTQMSNGGLPYQTNGGYQFNQYVGVEGDYLRYPDAMLNTNVLTKISNIENLVAKAMVPLDDNVNVFGKLGAAKVSPQIINNLSNSATNNPIGSHDKVMPYIGAGVGYGLNQTVGFNFQLDEMPKIDNQAPTIHSAMAGLNFKF
jgi:hypothetical protein